MDHQNQIEVVDREGWRRIYPLQKHIIHIGSMPGNDIILENQRGTGVSDRHIQLVATNNDRLSYQLINLGQTELILRSSEEKMIAPRGVVQLINGDAIQIGDFTLTFYLGTENGAGTFSTSTIGANIGLSISLPQRHLSPNQSMEGFVKVQNLGQQVAQFELKLFGLDDACYDLEPGPLLGPGASRETLLRLHHRGSQPAAGDLTITVRASAPGVYSEKKETSQVIRVMPTYRHKLRLLEPGETTTQSQINEDLLTPKAIDSPILQTQDRSTSPTQAMTNQTTAAIWADTPEVAPASPVQSSTIKLEAQRTASVESRSDPAQVNQEMSELWAAPPPPVPHQPAAKPEVSPEAAVVWGATPESNAPSDSLTSEQPDDELTSGEDEPLQIEEQDREDQEQSSTASQLSPEPKSQEGSEPTAKTPTQPIPSPPMPEQPEPAATKIDAPVQSSDQMVVEAGQEEIPAPISVDERLPPKREMGFKRWWRQAVQMLPLSLSRDKSPDPDTKSDTIEQRPSGIPKSSPIVESMPPEEVHQPPDDVVEHMPPTATEPISEEETLPPQPSATESLPEPQLHESEMATVVEAEATEQTSVAVETEPLKPEIELESEQQADLGDEEQGVPDDDVEDRADEQPVMSTSEVSPTVQEKESTDEPEWASTNIEDLWQADDEADKSTEKKQVLKLKAGSSQTSGPAADVQSELSPEVEEIWAGKDDFGD